MRYRYRENIWGNVFNTLCDLACQRIAVDGGYKLVWWFLEDPSLYSGANFKAEELEEYFTRLDVETPSGGYGNGYLKSIVCSQEHPDICIPTAVGGSASTYHCDYQMLSSSYTVRAVRTGGHSYDDMQAGLLCARSGYAANHSQPIYGGFLYVAQ
jgi:hypothetical protein